MKRDAEVNAPPKTQRAQAESVSAKGSRGRRFRAGRVADRLIVALFDKVVTKLSTSAKKTRWAKERLKSVQVIKDLPFCEDPHLSLDIYAPLGVVLPSAEELKSSSDSGVGDEPQTAGRAPFALYLHGGGFALFSKDTHWTYGVRLAEAGFITFVVNYRLAPKHPCPAGLEDCATALGWVLDRADILGIDLERGLIAGESAGGNLTMALLLCLLRRDSLPWASALFDRQWTPRMVAPACAFLDVSGVGRLPREMHPLFQWRVSSLGRKYLTDSSRRDLGEPLAELVAGVELERPCPPVMITVGDRDPVYRDSARLAEELERREIPHRFVVYPKGIHAFNAAIHRPLAEVCWRDHFAYWSEVTSASEVS